MQQTLTVEQQIHQRLSAMGDFFEVPTEKSDPAINSIANTPDSKSLVAAMEAFAQCVGISKKSADFYIRQSQLSGTI